MLLSSKSSSSLNVLQSKYSRYAVGIVTGIPLVAGLQGAYFLINFRQNHRNAPRPVSPSRGLVIVSPFDQNHVLHSSISNPTVGFYEEHHGGVNSRNCNSIGISGSKSSRWGGDKLQIKSQSKESYQKPKWWWYWRRHQSMESQIPLSLLVVGDSLAAGVGSTSGTPKLPEAIARSLSKALGGRPVYWTCHGRLSLYIYIYTLLFLVCFIMVTIVIHYCIGTPGAATSQIMKDIEKITEKTNERKKNSIVVDIFHSTIASIDRWFHRIGRRISGPREQSSAVKINQQNADVNERREINQWERIRTRFSVHANLNGKEMGQYDVVVVLTGLNDLKGIFLPFLQDESGKNQNSFKEELRKVFMVLSEKMKLQISKIKGSSDGIEESHVTPTFDKDGNETSLDCRPLVVIPALPTRPVPMLQYPPLSWFVHLLLELLDEEKRSLSKEYPDDILFIEAPSIEMIDEIEKGQSILIAKRKAEKLLLDLKDITRQVRDKIEKLIREHVDIHDQSDSESETELHYEASRDNNLTNRMPDHVGSKLISFDRVHPNDDGYDFWGRHIAEGIIKAWKHPGHDSFENNDSNAK